MSTSAVLAPTTKIIVSLPRPRVLLIDDDKKFLERAEEYFVNLDYDVDLARTPEEAQPLLLKHEYQLVAADIDFGNLSRTKGDRFVMDNSRLFGKAKRVLISAGEWLTPERRKQLADVDISFVPKAASVPERLSQITDEENAKRKKHIEDIVRHHASEITQITGTAVKIVMSSHAATATSLAPQPARLRDVAVQRMKRSLIKWLQTRGNIDEQVFAYGDRVYSANEMIDQIERETPVGVSHIEMMLQEFEDSLEDEIDDGNEYEDDEI